MANQSPLWAIMATTLALFFAPLAQACGVQTDCTLGDHSFRIQMPEGHDGTTPVGALIFAHGYKGSSAGTMRNTALRDLANRLGVALVAVDAIKDDWSLPNAPQAGTSLDVDEIAYFDALRATLLADYPIAADRLIVSGFSAGGMMVWNLACDRPQDYAGFIPIAGTFWAPMPAQCATPFPNVVHVHGREDKIVPLTGRRIAETKQGNVLLAIKTIYRDTSDYQETEAFTLMEGVDCIGWKNSDQAFINMCLHNGGHSLKADFIETAWKILLP